MEECSLTEENYLKSIFSLSLQNEKVLTSNLAEKLKTKPATVSSMLKKLSDKGFIHYEKYYGVSLTPKGMKIAVWVLRKHRLWETFLMEKLGFAWDRVHQIAEQLEHIKSKELIERLDNFLGNPIADPHGAPIPDKDGQLQPCNYQSLSGIAVGKSVKVKRVKNGTPSFLKYLDKTGISLNTQLQIQERFEFDHSLMLQIEEFPKHIQVSKRAAENLMVELIE